MPNIASFLNLALMVACAVVLVLMFQAHRARASAPSTAPAKFRLLSKLSCGVAVGWILVILLGGKPIWNGLCALMYGWLSYSFRQSALRIEIEALLEAAKNKQADEQAEKPNCEPPGA